MGNGPPPSYSALALVSTWLCLLSASQRVTEWGSIETNSFCHRQLMGFPRLGRKKAPAGLWLLILLRKHARNLPPGICSITTTTLPRQPTTTTTTSKAHLFPPKVLPWCIHRPNPHPPTKPYLWWRSGLAVFLWLATKETDEKKEGVNFTAV